MPGIKHYDCLFNRRLFFKLCSVLCETRKEIVLKDFA